MKKDIIFYIGNFFFPYGNAAGKRVYANGKLFRELGYDVKFIGQSTEINPKKKLEFSRKVFDNFEYYSFHYPNKKKEWLKYYKAFKEVIRLIEKNYQTSRIAYIIMYGSPRFSIFSLLVLNYFKRKNIKVLADSVDWLSTKTKDYLFNIVKTIHYSFQIKVVNRKADGVIVVSSFLDNYYKQRGCKTVIIPPLSPEEHNSEINLNLHNRPVLCYSGFPFRKGEYINNPKKLKDRIDLIIELLYNVKMKGVDFEFHIFGFDKEDYLQSLPNQKKYIYELGDSIIFHGFVSNDKVTEFIKRAHFTILLRDINRDTTAGFPTKVSESISLGTPVIFNDTSDIKNYVKIGISGYMLSMDSVDNDIKILRKILSKSKKEYINMKKDCVKMKTFSYQKYVSVMLKFLK